jgi:MFS family permease
MSPNLVLIWWARVIMSAGRALAGIVTALYLADRGFTGFGLALVFMVVALSSAVLSTVIGMAADRVGRRPFLIVLPLVTAAAGLVFATVTWIPALVTMAALGSFGRGAGAGAGAIGPYQSAEGALVTDEVPSRWRNTIFGRLAFGSSLGALVGSLLASVAHRGSGGAAAVAVAYRPAFILVASFSLVAGIVALWIREDRHVPDRKGPGRRPVDAATVRSDGPPDGVSSTATSPEEPQKRRWWRLRDPIRWPRRSHALLIRLWATNTVNGLAVGMFGPFITYWLYRRFGAGPGAIGVLFAVINVATMPSTLSAAGLARRFGLIRALTTMRLVQAVLIVPMVLSPSFVMAGGFYLLRMIAQRAGLPLRQSYVLAMADPEERATVAALSNLPSQVAMGVSPLLSGYLLDEVSLSLPFELAGALQAVSAAMYWLFFRKSAPHEERREPVGTGPAP